MGHKVDVIIPSYNYAHFLSKSAQSVLSQTYSDFRLLIIDNASTDNSHEVISDLLKEDSRVDYERNDHNLGFHPSLLKAIEMTSAEYLVILPADDFWHEDFLEKLMLGIESDKDVAYAYSNWCVTNNDNSTSQPSNIIPHIVSGKYDDSSLLITHNWIPLSFGIFKRKCFDEIGGINSNFSLLGDYDLWMRLSSRWPAYYCADILGFLRIHGENWSNELCDSGKAACEHALIEDRVFSQSDTYDITDRLLAKIRQISRITGRSLQEILGDLLNRSHNIYRSFISGSEGHLLLKVAEVILSNNKAAACIGYQSQYGEGRAALNLLDLVIKNYPDLSNEARIYYERHYDDDITYNYNLKNRLEPAASGGMIRMYAERMICSWNVKPTVYIVIRVDDGNYSYIGRTLQSIQIQIYSHLRVYIDMRGSISLEGWVTEYAEIINQEDFPSMLEGVFSDGWVLLISSGDTLTFDSIYHCIDMINQSGDARMVYGDNDFITDHGGSLSPCYKPDFNLEMLRSSPYLGGFCFFKPDEIFHLPISLSVNALCTQIAFLTHEHYGCNAILHVASIIHHSRYENNHKYEHSNLVEDHLNRCGVQHEIKSGLLSWSCHVNYLLSDEPFVSIMIPSKNNSKLLSSCIDSIIKKTHHINFEIIVIDNGSTDEVTLSYINSLKSGGDVTVLDYPREYNYSAINNYAATTAKGDYFLFLNDDTVVRQDDWLLSMVATCSQSNVGVVGPRLLFENETLQHAGVVIGLRGTAEHPSLTRSKYDPCYMGRPLISQYISAVTGACLLIKKDVFYQVGGFDEYNYAIFYNDIDLCLKAGESGYKTVYTPHVTLTHYHGVSRDKISEKNDVASHNDSLAYSIESFYRQWKGVIADDPCYNKNLSLYYLDPQIDTRLNVPWFKYHNDRPKVMAMPFDSWGSGNYRVRLPMTALSENALIELFLLPNHDQVGEVEYVIPTLSEMIRAEPTHLYMNYPFHNGHLDVIAGYKKYTNTKLILTLDDLVTNQPPLHQLHEIGYADIEQRLKYVLSHCDKLIVTTKEIAEAYQQYVPDIVVVPNYLDGNIWKDITKSINNSNKLRIGWAGSNFHYIDLEILIPVVKATSEYVDWIFMGDCSDEIRPYIKEFHYGVPFEQYPNALASLALDIAVAPLFDHPYNHAKSNLKVLEYGAIGYPVLCSNMTPYQSAPVLLVDNIAENWVEIIMSLSSDRDALSHQGLLLQQWVHANWMLEDHLDEWLSALG